MADKRIIDLDGLEVVISTIKDKLDLKADKSNFETLSSKVDGIDESVKTLQAASGEQNKINEITINGKEANVENKKATLTLTMTDIDPQGNYKTWTETDVLVGQKIANLKHASFEVVEKVPEASQAEENKFYLVKEGIGGLTDDVYSVYIKTNEGMQKIDDTKIDLSNYVQQDKLTTELNKKADKSELSDYAQLSALDDYVKDETYQEDKEELKTKIEDILDKKYGYGVNNQTHLSQENFTQELKEKLTNIKSVTVPEPKSGKIRLDATDVVVYELPNDVLKTTDIAETGEIESMIQEIFED